MTDLSAAGIYTDSQGLATLRKAARENSPEALRETARQFEGLFLQMMLKSMREALPGEGLFDSDQVKFYEGMFDQQLALNLAQGGSIGLAEDLYRQLGGEPQVPRSAQPLTSLYASLGSGRVSQSQPRTAELVRAPAEYAASKEQFIDVLWPDAVRAGASLGVAPEVLLAQSALETGWGQKVIRDPHGKISHNLFGIKADRGWSGPEASVATLEYEEGVAVKRRANFRAYASAAESFQDYVDFIRSNPRYRNAIEQSHDPVAYLQALQDAGYATDPNYATKIQGILKQEGFASQVSRLKESQNRPLT